MFCMLREFFHLTFTIGSSKGQFRQLVKVAKDAFLRWFQDVSHFKVDVRGSDLIKDECPPKGLKKMFTDKLLKRSRISIFFISSSVYFFQGKISARKLPLIFPFVSGHVQRIRPFFMPKILIWNFILFLLKCTFLFDPQFQRECSNFSMRSYAMVYFRHKTSNSRFFQLIEYLKSPKRLKVF